MRQNEWPDSFESNPRIWKILFFSVLVAYCLCYAPFGINETDGGFLTGLAWQVLSGKALYREILYVRPPFPVWLRALELQVLPENCTVLGERWIFYLKVGLYSWLGAAILTGGTQRWMLATFGFVVSVHCYPPMAWHTVDGILCSVLGIWFLMKTPSVWNMGLGAVFMFAALLCKQSFYPMAAVFLGLLFFRQNFPKVDNFRKIAPELLAFLFCIILFFSYLSSNSALENYLRLTGGPASGGQALQHGVLDYFRIKPALALWSAVLLAPVVWHFWKRKNAKIAYWGWDFWLSLLAGTYAFSVWSREEFGVPFSQARLLFWTGVLFAIFLKKEDNTLKFSLKIQNLNPRLLALLAVSWCASVSWGYNLPILFSTPWVFAVMEITRHLWQQAYPGRDHRWHSFVALLGLLALFRLSYEFVYRDGRRSEMNAHLGDVFPQLSGIYSTPEKEKLYLDLKNLAARYPNFKTLPAFPQANFLTKTPPPFPLDWVVNRETNGDNTLILKNLKESRTVLFIEKTWLGKIPADPELTLTRDLLRSGTVLDEAPHFLIVKPE